MVEEHLVRNKGSMKGFLALAKVPLEPPDDNTIQQLREARESAMTGETALIWALQDLECPESRQALPMWVAKPVEQFVMTWADEKSRWSKVLQDRHLKGKDSLTECQEKGFQDFKEHRSEIRLLFNQEEQRSIHRVQSKAELKKAGNKLFSMKVTADYETGCFQVKTGKGAVKELVLLKGEPTESDPVPECLGGVAADIASAVVNGELECEAAEAVIIGLDEEENMADMDHMEDEKAWEEEKDLEEVCCNTSDEEVVTKAMCGSDFKKVKSFFHRPAFQKLDSQGLVMIPSHVHGAFLSFHATSSTWQAFYPDSTVQMSFTFGGKAKSNLADFL